MVNQVLSYDDFLAQKAQAGVKDGFKPSFIPDFLFPFQQVLTEFSIETGRSQLLADCGLGKTPMELVWAENVHRHTNKPVLNLTMLSVVDQFVREGEKFGVECRRSTNGKIWNGINIANYERLHYFNPNDFGGVVCDESSILKHFSGATQKAVTNFLLKVPYRLLTSATAAPNDHIEWGTASEALGYLGRMDMLSTFFKNDEDSLHPTEFGSKWMFKAHAEPMFWRWLASFARAIRRPSDMGFSDEGFALPPLEVFETVVENPNPFMGGLFPTVATTMAEQREENRLTIRERCEAAAELLDHNEPGVAWCQLNDEADLMVEMIPGSRQIKGTDPDERKEEILKAFASGELKKLVTKPTITAFGLNWQHCAHLTYFPSHSFEQYYQAIRRFWRFGQPRPVRADLVITEGNRGMMQSIKRKEAQANEMFDRLVACMNDAMHLDRSQTFDMKTEVPSWLS